MKTGAKIGIGIGVAIAAVIAVAVAWPAKPVAVETARVERGAVEERVSSSASGDVEPKARAALRAETVGSVTKVAVQAGARVKAGDLLLSLDDRPLAAALAAARVQDETARRDLATATALRAKAIITDQALQQAQSAADLAHANLQVAQANLERATVRAPFDGLLTRLPVQVGDGVIVGQTLAEVVDDSSLYVRAAFDEVDAVKVKLGAPASVRLDAYPDDPLAATVDRIDPVVGGDTISGVGSDAVAIAGGRKDRTVGVRVAIAPATSAKVTVLVGMSADVEVILGRKDGVLRVPAVAVFHEEGKQFAWVVRDGRIAKREVATGTTNWEFDEVLSGLADGETVVTSLDVAGVKAGARAVPKPRASATATPPVASAASSP